MKPTAASAQQKKPAPNRLGHIPKENLWRETGVHKAGAGGGGEKKIKGVRCVTNIIQMQAMARFTPTPKHFQGDFMEMENLIYPDKGAPQHPHLTAFLHPSKF